MAEEKTIAAITVSDLANFLLARLESAYLLIWGAHEIWGQSIGTFVEI